MTDKTCGTCKHWDRESYGGDRYGVCGFVLHRSDHDEPHSDRAEVEDSSGYHAVLSCCDTFGCIEHEEGGE